MPTPQTLEDAAIRLIDNRRRLRAGPGDAPRHPLPTIEQVLPADARPEDDVTAYAIQDALIAKLGKVGGWKVAGSGPSGPSCAPVFSEVLHAAAGPLPWKVAVTTEYECEIGFEMGHDLPVRGRPYTAQEVATAVRATRVTIELLEPRLQGSGTPLDRWVGIADGQACGALVVGGETGNGFVDVDCAQQPVRITVDGVEVHRAVGGNALPRLLPLLVWLANHLAGRGVPLTTGQVVTTGSCTGKRPWGDAREVRVDFESVGRLVVASCR